MSVPVSFVPVMGFRTEDWYLKVKYMEQNAGLNVS